jgi:hypothetical protein
MRAPVHQNGDCQEKRQAKTPAAHQNRYKALAAARAIRLAANAYTMENLSIPPQMADHEGRKLSVREMINAHLFPLLALVATASSVSIALSLGPIAGQSYRWNKCYDAGLAWLERTSPTIKGGDRTAIAANFCNGGLPNKPAR